MRLLGIAVASAAGLLAAAVLSLTALVAEPGWLLNGRMAAAVLRRVGKSYRPSWTELDLRVESRGWAVKRVVLHARDLCVDDERGRLKGCLAALDADATVRLGLSPLVRVLRLETLSARTGPVVRWDRRVAAAADAGKKKPASLDATFVPLALRGMTVGVVGVRVPRVELVGAGGTTVVSGSAAFSEKKKAPLTADLYAVVPGTSPATASHYRAKLSLDTDLLLAGSASRLDGRVALRGDGGLRAELSAKLRNPRPDELALTAELSARMGGRTARGSLNGLFAARRDSATGSISVEDPNGPLRRAALENCRLDAPLDARGSLSASLKCAIVLAPKSFGLKKTKPVPGTLDLDVNFERAVARRDRFTASLNADIAPDRDWYGFFARLRMKLAGRASRLPGSLTEEHDLKTGFEISDFQEFVGGLAHTDLAVPAPLNALKGRVKFDARTAGAPRGEAQRIDYTATTELNSARQRLNVAATGRLTIDGLFLSTRRVKDETDVDLKDVALELPYLKLGPVPNPIADSRIKTKDAKKSGGSAIDYTVRVRTEKPVLLKSNLNADQIPIALDLKATTAGAGGKITVEPFDLKIFRQTARVDHFTAELAPASSDVAIDGKIVYKKADTVVDILFMGTADKPAVAFQSQPPMSQDEIVALLLYDKSPAELDSDQTTSAGAAAAGFTSGAFGLASLYLFAETPVDSVNYDAASQTYQVKFKLPGGLTLGVASNMEESRSLTLRRRVARNVEVETELQHDDPTTGTTGNAVTTFLEWFHRY